MRLESQWPSEGDSHITGEKSFEFSRWAATTLGKSSYRFIAKADEDTVINPIMLHLALAKVDVESKGGPVFWGKEWFWSDVGFAYKQGPLYAMSSDLTQHFLPLASYQVSSS